MNITLHPITQDNWQACIALEVQPEQADFVAPNLFSIAQAQFYPSWQSLGVYERDTMVGYALIGKRHPSEAVWWIFRMMIGRQYQERGYSKAVVRMLIELLHARADCREIRLSYDETNLVAERLYRGFGFEPSGRINEHGDAVEHGGEIVLRLRRAAVEQADIHRAASLWMFPTQRKCVSSFAFHNVRLHRCSELASLHYATGSKGDVHRKGRHVCFCKSLRNIPMPSGTLCALV